jgi:predicted methyltransferase
MKHALVLAVSLAAAVLAGCGQGGEGGEGAAGGAAGTKASTGKAGTLEWAVAGEWRPADQKARDVWRHPVETLTFFGIENDDTVVELFPGAGWYTSILGPYLQAGGGVLYAAMPDPASSDYARENVEAFRAAFVDRPQSYGDVRITVASRESTAGIAPDGSADVVLTFRNVHNWMAGGYADKIFRDAYRALKPGGVLGVVEHRLPSSMDQDLYAASGYVQESYVQQLAEAAGFVLEEASEINANPEDTRNHPLGVWMLPPNMRAPEPGTPEAEGYDPEVYKAMGESDRMTLRFRKPGGAAE